MRADDVVDLERRQYAVAPVLQRAFDIRERVGEAQLVHLLDDDLNPLFLRLGKHGYFLRSRPVISAG